MRKNKNGNNQKKSDYKPIARLFGMDTKEAEASTKQMPLDLSETGQETFHPKAAEGDMVDAHKFVPKREGILKRVSLHNQVIHIELDKLIPNEKQTRVGYGDRFPTDPEEILALDPTIKELAESIRINGLLQPVGVIAKDQISNDWIVVFGHRRVLAHIFLGEKSIRAIPMTLGGSRDDEFIIKNFTENIVRKDMNPIEKMKAIKKIAKEKNMTYVSALTGISLRTLSRYTRLDKLAPKIKKYIQAEKNEDKDFLNMNFLYELSNLPRKTQMVIFEKMEAGKIGYKDLMKLVKAHEEEKRKKTMAASGKIIQKSIPMHPAVETFLKDYQEEFEYHLESFLVSFLQTKNFDFGSLKPKKTAPPRETKTGKKRKKPSIKVRQLQLFESEMRSEQMKRDRAKIPKVSKEEKDFEEWIPVRKDAATDSGSNPS